MPPADNSPNLNPLTREEAKFLNLEVGLRRRASLWYQSAKKPWSFMENDALRFLGILARWLMENPSESRLAALEQFLSETQELLRKRSAPKKVVFAKAGEAFMVNHPDLIDPERAAVSKLLAKLAA